MGSNIGAAPPPSGGSTDSENTIAQAAQESAANALNLSSSNNAASDQALSSTKSLTATDRFLFDAQSQNNNARSVRRYTDLDLFFSKKLYNSDVSEVVDIQAVKRSVRNLVLTNIYEKPFHPEIASGVRGMLFELMTPVTAVIISRQIEDVIVNFEPRVKLVGVRAIPDLDRNAYEVSIEFYVVNTPTELVELTIFLERLR